MKKYLLILLGVIAIYFILLLFFPLYPKTFSCVGCNYYMTYDKLRSDSNKCRLTGIDVNSFSVIKHSLNREFKDKNGLYSLNNQQIPGCYHKITNISSPLTFERLSTHYAKDQDNVYFLNKIGRDNLKNTQISNVDLRNRDNCRQSGLFDEKARNRSYYLYDKDKRVLYVNKKFKVKSNILYTLSGFDIDDAIIEGRQCELKNIDQKIKEKYEIKEHKRY